MSRCRNCGETDHETQFCTVDGPWFPAADRTKESYEEERQRISKLLAADILAEHESLHQEDGGLE